MTATLRSRPPTGPLPTRRSAATATDPTLEHFRRAQSVNLARGVSALRPFRDDEFGTGAGAPSRAHLRAVNDLMEPLRRTLRRSSVDVTGRSRAGHGPDQLGRLLEARGRAERQLKAAESIWDWYFEMFSQRSTRFGPWLAAADRIALDCYQTTFTGLGRSRSVPTPPPFSYLETGFTPSTFRRGVALTRLGKRGNPFPVVQIPLHRMVNPWTLGAINHEVAHNLQSDLGMWSVVPRRLRQRLTAERFPRDVVTTWARWHKEIWADLAGLLLGGPAIVASLMDVVAKPRRAAMAYNPLGVHPTPYLRPGISTELLRRLGFGDDAARYDRTWARLYPSAAGSDIPRPLLATIRAARSAVVDEICFRPYQELGGRSLSQVIPYPRTRPAMVVEAAGRLAAGVDPGIIPPRYLIAAARIALDRRLAPPGRITANFYEALGGRS